MKMRYILFFMMLFMFLLGSVSAVDVSNQTDYLKNNMDNDILSVDENFNNDVLSTDVSGGNFRKLNDAVWNSNQITLTGDFNRVDGDTDIILQSGKVVTIEGNGHVMNGNNLGRAFILLPGSELTIHNVKFMKCNGYSPSYDSSNDGGAILNMGKLTLIDCTFENNVARDGGAISCDINAQTLISGTTVFSKNSATYDGGAIKNYGNSPMTIEGKVTFDSNSVAGVMENDGKGGAILNQHSDLILVGEGIFNNNAAIWDGGAIFNNEATMNINGNFTFTNNNAFGNTKTGRLGYGGAINNEDGTLYLDGINNFISNSAYRGGAIDTSINSKITISGTNTFKNNNAGFQGGAICVQNAESALLTGYNVFESNTADAGGAISYYGTPATISGTNIFSGNTAVYSGGAIQLGNIRGSSITGHSYFYDNKATGDGGSGGAIYAIDGSMLNIKGAAFFRNTGIYGGAIHVCRNPISAMYNIFYANSAVTGADVEVYQSDVQSLNQNYWGVQSRPSQDRIHNYDIGNIGSWVILKSIIPNEIKYAQSTDLIYFVQNSGSGLSEEMADLDITVTPNFNPNPLTISKNVGVASYSGDSNTITVTLSGPNYTDSKTVNVVGNFVATKLSGNDVLLWPDERGKYIATLEDANGNLLANQNIKLVFNGQTSTAVTSNKGQVSLDISGLSAGHYDINAFFDGKDNYLSSNKSNYVVVFSNDSNNSQINANNISMLYKDGTRFVATVTDMNNNPLKNVKMGFVINNITYMRDTNDKGQASIPLNLVANEYNVLSYFIGDGNYLPVLTENTVVIGSTISASDIVKYYKNDTQYIATFRNSDGSYLAKGTQVDFNINGVHYHRSIRDDMGNTLFNINLGPGKYILTAINANGEQIASNIEVLTVFDEHNDIVKYYKNATQYCVSLLDGSGNPIGAGASVEFNINGVFYTRTTNESGIAKMNINLSEGDYIITATYNGLAVSNTIKVLPVMFGNDMVKKYSDVAAYEVRLINGVGDIYPNQTITFNINGVFYNRTTGDDGIARLNIRLINGEYIITSEYNGFLISNTVTVTP